MTIHLLKTNVIAYKSIIVLLFLGLIAVQANAADNLPQTKDTLPTFNNENQNCYGNTCTNQDTTWDMFKKPDRFDHRQRTDPWSTSDYDNSDTRIRVRTDTNRN